MASAIIQVAMPFQPLLKQIVDFLKFPEPIYRIIDRATNNVYLRIDTNNTNEFRIFLGGPAGDPEDSCEKAARSAVRTLMRVHRVSVEDVTSLLRRDFERCIGFYKAKCMELQSCHLGVLRKKNGKGVADSAPFLSPQNVVVDFVAIAMAIFDKIPIVASTVDTAQLDPGQYTALITLTPPDNPHDLKCVFGESARTIEGATQNLAKNVILYLLSVYKLKIVDANYSASQARLDPILCSRERQTCLDMKAHLDRVKEPQEPSTILADEDCITPKGVANQVPAASAPPLPPNKKPYNGVSAKPSSALGSRTPTSNCSPIPSELEMVFKRTKFM